MTNPAAQHPPVWQACWSLSLGPAGTPHLHRRLESELQVERQAAAADLHGLVHSHEAEVWLYLAAGPGVPLGLAVAAHYPQPGHFLWVERWGEGWAAVDVELGRPVREEAGLTEEGLAAMAAASGADCLLSSARDGLGFLQFGGTWVELDASVLDRPPGGPLLLESAELGGLLPRGPSFPQILAAHWRLGLAGIGVAAGLLASSLWLWPDAEPPGAAVALAPAPPAPAAIPGPETGAGDDQGSESALGAASPPLPEPAPPPLPPPPPAPLTAAELLTSLAGLAVWLHARDAATASIRLTPAKLCWRAAFAPQSLGPGLQLPPDEIGADDGGGACTPLSSPAMRGLAAQLSGLLPAEAAWAGEGLDDWKGQDGELRLHAATPLSWLALAQRLRDHPRVRLRLFRARLGPSGDWRDVHARLDWREGGGDGAS